MMRSIGSGTIVLAFLSLCACASVEDAPRGEAAYAIIPAAPAIGAEHPIGPDDVLRVDVYREPGFSLEDARVSATGQVRMPFIGEVPVAGLSAGEAADVIAGRLAQRYLVSPQVTIFVKKAVARRVTVEGEVRQPGLFPIEGRIGLVQAVALAGGQTRLASASKVVVVRQSEGQRTAALFDLGAIRKGEAADPEILPGDTIFVGMSAAKAALGGLLLSARTLAAGFVVLDGGR